MTRYLVTTSVFTLDADSPIQAAQMAFSLHDQMTPESFTVVEFNPTDALADGQTFYVSLEQEDKDEARRAHANGEYFKEVDISGIDY